MRTREAIVTGAMAAWLLWPGAVHAEQALAEVAWSSPPKGAEVTPGLVIRPEEGIGETATVENAEGKALSARLLVLRAPPITEARYAILGKVKYEGVEGDGYLELWNMFPDGGAFFSRTMAPGGPMGILRGSAGWREFALPFSSREGYVPNELVMNVVLPGRGRVWVGPVRLVQYAPSEAAFGLRVSGAWWSGATAGLVFGGLGGLLGCVGGLIGVLAARGKARGLVFGLLRGYLVLGAVAVTAGSTAFALGQPYEVWYPLALCGVLGVSLGLALPRLLRRRYEQADPQRKQAPGAGGTS